MQTKHLDFIEYLKLKVKMIFLYTEQYQKTDHKKKNIV